MSAYSYLLLPEDKTSQNEVDIPVHRENIENNNKNFELMNILKEHS